MSGKNSSPPVCAKAGTGITTIIAAISVTIVKTEMMRLINAASFPGNLHWIASTGTMPPNNKAVKSKEPTPLLLFTELPRETV
jgi:hypothetical protein